jgi:hypothetical protein
MHTFPYCLLKSFNILSLELRTHRWQQCWLCSTNIKSLSAVNSVHAIQWYMRTPNSWRNLWSVNERLLLLFFHNTFPTKFLPMERKYVLILNTRTFPGLLVFLMPRTHHHHHHWLDSPMWALALLRSLCQLSFSITKFVQFFTPKVLISWITSSSHLSLGLPLFLIPTSLVLNTFLTVLLLSLCVTCSAQPNLFILIYITMSG